MDVQGEDNYIDLYLLIASLDGLTSLGSDLNDFDPR